MTSKLRVAESEETTGAQPAAGGEKPSFAAALQNCEEKTRVEPNFVSKIKGTKEEPLAESEIETLTSQAPSLPNRGILMEASPLASETANKNKHLDRKATMSMPC